MDPLNPLHTTPAQATTGRTTSTNLVLLPQSQLGLQHALGGNSNRLRSMLPSNCLGTQTAMNDVKGRGGRYEYGLLAELVCMWCSNISAGYASLKQECFQHPAPLE